MPWINNSKITVCRTSASLWSRYSLMHRISCRASFRIRGIPLLLHSSNSHRRVSMKLLKYNWWIKMIKTNTEQMRLRIHLWLRISIEDSRDSNSSHREIIWKQMISTIRILTHAVTPPCTFLTVKWPTHSTPNTTIQASSKCRSNSRCSRELSHLLRAKIACTDSNNSNTTMRAEGSHSMMNNKFTTQTRTLRMKESQEFLMEMIARIRYSPDNSIFNDLIIIFKFWFIILSP